MQIKLPIELIELEGKNFHPVIASEINGRKAIWIIDTGASKTVFDVNRNGDYKLLNEREEIHSVAATDQPVTATLAEIKSVRIGKLVVKDLLVALIDFSAINKLYSKKGGHEICGLIGSDFLIGHNAVINYKKRVLKLNVKAH